MKKIILVIISVLLFITPVCHAGFLDNLLKDIGLSAEQGPDNSTVISGLKGALSVGTENTVKEVSQIDGYLANEAIKILIPEKIRMVTDMNRSAEKAAVKAAPHFVDAIKEMTFDDARNILDGHDTAATDYFRLKTFDRLYSEFKPVISSSMNEVGTTRNYKAIMGKYESLPFMKAVAFDLDDYVTNKALDGLFYVLAQEEKKIRTDPAARVTDILKKVFTK
jgi:hypothetical protein